MYKRQTSVFLFIIFASILINYLVYINYTKYILEEAGDLSRVSYDLSYKNYKRNTIVDDITFKIIEGTNYSLNYSPEIITFGDSFMNGSCEKTWLQNYINRDVVHLHAIITPDNIMTILNQIKDNPPKYFIIERIERGLYKTFLKVDFNNMFYKKGFETILDNKKVLRDGDESIKYFKFLNNANLKFFIKNILDFDIDNFYLLQLKSILFNISGVKKLLANNSFFTVEPDKLFFSNDDYKSEYLSDLQLNKIVNQFEFLNKTLELYGTKLIVLVVPDKLTLYGKYLKIPIKSTFYNNLLSKLEENGVKAVNILEVLEEKLFSVKDIYQPDDTHFSRKGAVIVGKGISEYLNKLEGSD